MEVPHIVPILLPHLSPCTLLEEATTLLPPDLAMALMIAMVVVATDQAVAGMVPKVVPVTAEVEGAEEGAMAVDMEGDTVGAMDPVGATGDLLGVTMAAISGQRL